MSICLSVCLSLYAYVFLCPCLGLFKPLYMHKEIISVSLSLSLSFSFPLYMPSIWASVCLSISLSIYIDIFTDAYKHYRDIIAYIIMYSTATHLYWNSMHRSDT